MPPRLPSLLLVLLALGAPGRADEHVAVKFSANPAYAAERQREDGSLHPESYVFIQGEFLPGAIRDKSLDNSEISAVAHALAPHLAQRNYLPTTETGDADLVIAVHWGMTTSLQHNTDYVAMMMDQARDTQLANKEFAEAFYGSAENDATAPAQSDLAQEMLKASARQAAAAPDYDWARMASARSERDISNRPIASVLGFSDVLNRDSKRAFASEEARTLMHYLNEERYFVVLMAYDLKRRKSGEPFQRLWVARISIPAAGINFNEALERLGTAGATGFGENNPDLQIKRIPTPKRTGDAEVEVGDIIVIEEDVD